MTTQQILDHLIRSFKAFNALVRKLDHISANDEFRGVWTLHEAHGGIYMGPTWEPELTEAKECLKVALSETNEFLVATQNPFVSNHTQEEQDNQNHKDNPHDATGTVTPASTPTPVGQSADQEQDKNDNKDRA